jgi:protein-disulfide isomerase
VAHPKQNLPRALRNPTAHRPATHHPSGEQSKARPARIAALCAIAAAALATATLVLLGHTSSQAALETRTSHEVTAVFAGVPQHQDTLGNPTAPVTLEVFGDLKDADSAGWFVRDLPAIVQDYVRPGVLKLVYRGFKRNTFSPQEFVKEQTAALAAGARDKLWNYTDTFYHEQHNEFATYVTNAYLTNIARQIPGLNLGLWRTDLHTERREEQATAEDQTAHNLGLHVTPAFRIGLTGHPLHNYAGHIIIKNQGQHPFAMPEAQDITNAIKELGLR